MTITIKGNAKEIAALVLAVQERREPIKLELLKAEPGEYHFLTVDEMPGPLVSNNLPPDIVLRELGAK